MDSLQGLDDAHLADHLRDMRVYETRLTRIVKGLMEESQATGAEMSRVALGFNINELKRCRAEIDRAMAEQSARREGEAVAA